MGLEDHEIFLVCTGVISPWPIQGHGVALTTRGPESSGVMVRHLTAERKVTAAAARLSMRAQSRFASASVGVSHEPPTHNTFGRRKYDPAVFAVMPPVAQKRASGKGFSNASRSSTPPATVAGKI
jgi:hypothetical protein